MIRKGSIVRVTSGSLVSILARVVSTTTMGDYIVRLLEGSGAAWPAGSIVQVKAHEAKEEEEEEENCKLRPCPFCGTSPEPTWGVEMDYLDGESPRSVVCRSCDASGPLADTEEEATHLWNTRVEISKLKDERQDG